MGRENRLTAHSQDFSLLITIFAIQNIHLAQRLRENRPGLFRLGFLYYSEVGNTIFLHVLWIEKPRVSVSKKDFCFLPLFSVLADKIASVFVYTDPRVVDLDAVDLARHPVTVF